ncbi:MAG: lipocalin-like domain-containing protein [Candidatus Sericytochromatia bacterium]|nr:lipocalin-like domain-containing protein [Candidatus Sericytochromatia bacterium]
MFRAILLVAVTLLSACGSPLPRVGPDSAILAAASAPAADRAAYVSGTADALETALREGDARSFEAFVAWAEGADPDPIATRAILARVLERTSGSAVLAAGARAWRVRLATLSQRVAPKVRAVAAKAPIRLPVDETAHPRALTEWWYLNGHLTDGKRRYGFEYTLFKVGPLLRWAHVALTEESSGRFRYLREPIRRREALEATDKLDLAYGGHRFRAIGPEAWSLTGRTDGAQLDLDFSTTKSPMLMNGDGIIDMPEGDFSWYYSRTRLDTRGSLLLDGRRLAVTGLSWFDHQWGPFYVTGFKERWDWFSIQTDDGTDYNLFGFRNGDGTVVARYANVLDAEGRLTTARAFDLERRAWWQSPRTRKWYTTSWALALPDRQETFRLDATVPEQELARRVPFLLDPLPEYWEGSMKVARTGPGGQAVSGFAYCEHFGFTERPQAR